MKTLAIFGGTTEGRLLAEALAGSSVYQCHVYAATEYGASLLPRSGNIIAHAGRLDGYAMKAELGAIRPELVIDATHPYATAVSDNLRRTSDSLRLTYIRIARAEESGTDGASGDRSVTVRSAAEAAAFLDGKEGRILLTTGSKELEAYTSVSEYQERVYARVLPLAEVLEKCSALGYPAGHIIAMQGPFSQALNEQLIRDLSVSWLVTKESGMTGGYPEKCEAALACGCGLVIIGRPGESEDAVSLDAVIRMLSSADDAGKTDGTEGSAGTERSPEAETEKEQPDDTAAEPEDAVLQDPDQTIALIGVGPGNPEEMTVRAVRFLEEADLLVGSERAVEAALSLLREKENAPEVFISVRPSEIADHLRSHPGYRKTAVLYSGDIALYSGASLLAPLLPGGVRVLMVNGISSVPYFLAREGVPMEKVTVHSLHGRDLDPVPDISRNEYTLLLAGRESTLSELSEKLVMAGLPDAEIVVGERLSYPDEEIIKGTPESFVGRTSDPLSLILVRNSHPRKDYLGFGEEDGAFVRSSVTDRHVPMTKREIRALALSMLRLTEDSVMYDIGAGTGSVSAEAARALTRGRVYAIEQRPEAVELMRTNQMRMNVSNMTIVEGHAPEAMFGLPAPSHAFIGGSSGTLKECVEELRRRNSRVRIVASAVTEETLRELTELRDGLEQECRVELTEIQVIRSRKVGGYHMRQPGSPVVLAEIIPLP